MLLHQLNAFQLCFISSLIWKDAFLSAKCRSKEILSAAHKYRDGISQMLVVQQERKLLYCNSSQMYKSEGQKKTQHKLMSSHSLLGSLWEWEMFQWIFTSWMEGMKMDWTSLSKLLYGAEIRGFFAGLDRDWFLVLATGCHINVEIWTDHEEAFVCRG